MAGMRVVVVAALDDGTVDLEDLRRKCEEHSERLAAIMVTYPSTHGVYEEGISDMCALVHQHGGQVYIDGANLNALLGLAEPGQFGGDVSHLNLHKTFCIPHGGGGPGVGPVAVAEHLVPFLPSHPLHPRPAQREGIGPVSAAPFGSAGILSISWAYIRMLSGEGLAHATKSAVLAANYVAARLAPSFPILYTGKHGLVAHECILDLRPLTKATGVTVDDVAKRLIDYGFHAPTVSFPVAGTLMVEPTESEDLAELDRFCDAMIAIRAEIDEVAAGRWAVEDSPLRGAPHTAAALVSAWERAYDRRDGGVPVGQTAAKYWPPVARINQAYGDRNLVCTCPPPEAFEDSTPLEQRQVRAEARRGGSEADDEPAHGVEDGLGAMAGVDEVHRLPARGGPGRVAAAQADADDGEQVGAEPVVEREPGEDAEQERARRVDEHRAQRERVGRRTPTWWITSARSDRAGPAGQRRRRGRGREWGRSAHAGTIRRPSAVPTTTRACRRSTVPRDTPRRSRCHRPWPAAPPRPPGWSRWSIPRGSRRRGAAGPGALGDTCSVSGTSSPMASEPERLMTRVTQGKLPCGDRVVGIEQIAGHGAERAADEDGQQRGRRQAEARDERLGQGRRRACLRSVGRGC